MELQHLKTEPGDVILPPFDDSEDEVATLFYYEDGDIWVVTDEEEPAVIVFQIGQADDFIEAIKTVKENNA